ncbi:antibiotic biosynthesis monooxygenase [Streptomyces sp. NPDC052701]|uniref:putative quinol monooxygenase n=1 Tax=Streptomyces sp. NPDC052701 TaxID=3155533 RepID=UPI00343119E4
MSPTTPSSPAEPAPGRGLPPDGTGGGHVAIFDILRVDGAATADALAGRIAREAAAWAGAPGFLLSRVHIALDGRAVVHHTRWSGEARHSASRPGPAGAGAPRAPERMPGVLSATSFRGAPAGGITGPAAGRAPGIVAVATRHFAGPRQARAVLDLLHRTGEWKRDFDGFISATPYLDHDGRTFVNYPMWTDRSAYDAWMADPRIAEGQGEIARLETAPPEYLVCTVASEAVAAPAEGTA